MKNIVGGAVVAVPVVNEVTNQGVITALDLELVSMLGMTYGAWFKIGMGVALALLIVERGMSIRNKIFLSRRRYDYNKDRRLHERTNCTNKQ